MRRKLAQKGDDGANDEVVGIIDVHAHYYPDFYLDALKASAGPFEYKDDAKSGMTTFLKRGGLAMGLPADMPSIEERVKALDENGIEAQILSMAGPPPESFLVRGAAQEMASAINDSMISVCQATSGRFLMFASVDFSDTDFAIAEIDRIADHEEVTGILALTNVNGVRLDDEDLDPLWEEVNRLRLVVFVHPTTPVDPDIARRGSLALHIGFPQETAKLITGLYFSHIFDRYPMITWVFCHLGGGLHAIWERFMKSGERGNVWRAPHRSFEEASKRVYYDCVSGHAPAIRLSYDTVGAARIVFGSDCPHVPLDNSLGALRSLGLPAMEEHLILRKNAYGFIRRNSNEGGA